MGGITCRFYVDDDYVEFLYVCTDKNSASNIRSEVYQTIIANQFPITELDNAICKRKRWGSELPQQTFYSIL